MTEIILLELQIIEDLTTLLTTTLKMLSQYADISEFEKKLEDITRRA